MKTAQVIQFGSMSLAQTEERHALAKGIFVAFCGRCNISEFKAAEAASDAYHTADAFLLQKSLEQDLINEAYLLKEKGVKNLISWVEKNGSDNLKNEFGDVSNISAYSLELAESEFFKANAPEGFSPFNDQNLASVYTTAPTEEEALELSHFKKLVRLNPDVYSDAKLFYIKYFNHSNQTEIDKHMLLLTIKAPNYSTLKICKVISETENRN